MSIYKKSIIITSILSGISLLIAIILNYVCNEQFWCNVCLGVFGSSLLTFVTSMVGYFSERRNCLEGFYTETLKYISKINTYQKDLALCDKVDFFLEMIEYDKTIWDSFYGKMDFFNNSKTRKYIYEKIYTPIKEVDQSILRHSLHFREYKNGKGRVDEVIRKFIEEIEPFILTEDKYLASVENGETLVATYIRNRILTNIFTELNGHYYEIMYGKKKALAMEDENGKDGYADNESCR